MKYTENDVTFNDVKTPNVLISGVLGRKGRLSINNQQEEITISDKAPSLINAIDIDWDGAEINGTTINTTAQLLNYIKNNSGGENNENQNDRQIVEQSNYYKWFEKGEYPATPTQDELRSWNKNFASNRPGKNYILWMCQVFIYNDFTSIKDPIQISGEDGLPGEDTTKREYIYKLFKEVQTNFPNNYTNPAFWEISLDDNYTGPESAGWSNDAKSVSEWNTCEYMSFRDKKKDRNGNIVWSKFSNPILWSHYGVNGMDGAGIEYVFIRTSLREAPRIVPQLGESGLTDEYLPVATVDSGIISGSNAINTKTARCTDDPVGINSEYPYEWVLKRKKINGIWESYSTKRFSLWGIKGIDGTGSKVEIIDGKLYINDEEKWSLEGANGQGMGVPELENPPSGNPGNSSKIVLYNGTVYVWNDTNETWVAIGQSSGSGGVMHIAFADNVTINNGQVYSITGFTVNSTSTSKKWTGICFTDSPTDPGADLIQQGQSSVDINNISPGSEISKYKWNFQDAVDGNGVEFIFCLTKEDTQPEIFQQGSSYPEIKYTSEEISGHSPSNEEYYPLVAFKNSNNQLILEEITTSTQYGDHSNRVLGDSGYYNGQRYVRWTDDPNITVNSTWKYLWEAIRKKNSSGWQKFGNIRKVDWYTEFPSQMKYEEAWSNEATTQNKYTSPSDIQETDWSLETPEKNSKKYLWRRSSKWVLDPSTNQYVNEKFEHNNEHYTYIYIRLDGTNGTEIAIKGNVEAVVQYANEGLNNLDPNPKGGDLGINLSGRNNTILEYKNSSWQFYKTLEPEKYIIHQTTKYLYSYTNEYGWEQVRNINISDGDTYVNNDTGTLWMWSAESGNWVCLGQFQGKSGKTYYTHIAWATSVTLYTGQGSLLIGAGSTQTNKRNVQQSTDVIGFSIGRDFVSNTQYPWQGILIDENPDDPDSNCAHWYTWTYIGGSQGIKGDSNISVDLDNQHEDMIYSDAGKVGGDITSQATLWNGHSSINSTDAIWEINDGEGPNWCVASNKTSENAIAYIDRYGKLTVEELLSNQVKIKVRATYDGNQYYASFTSNKTKGDKYELILSPNAISYNTSITTYPNNTINNINIKIQRTDIQGNVSFINSNEISSEGNKGNLRLFATYSNEQGVLPELHQIYEINSDFGVSKTIADNSNEIYFQLRKYSNINSPNNENYKVLDYESIPICKVANGNSTVIQGANGITYLIFPPNILLEQSTEKVGNTYPINYGNPTENREGSIYVEIRAKRENVNLYFGQPQVENDYSSTHCQWNCRLCEGFNAIRVWITSINPEFSTGKFPVKLSVYSDLGRNNFIVNETIDISWWINLLGTWKQSVEDGIEYSVSEKIIYGLNPDLNDEPNLSGNYGINTYKYTGEYIRGWLEQKSTLSKEVNGITTEMSEIKQTSDKINLSIFEDGYQQLLKNPTFKEGIEDEAITQWGDLGGSIYTLGEYFQLNKFSSSSPNDIIQETSDSRLTQDIGLKVEPGKWYTLSFESMISESQSLVSSTVVTSSSWVTRAYIFLIAGKQYQFQAQGYVSAGKKMWTQLVKVVGDVVDIIDTGSTTSTEETSLGEVTFIPKFTGIYELQVKSIGNGVPVYLTSWYLPSMQSICVFISSNVLDNTIKGFVDGEEYTFDGGNTIFLEVDSASTYKQHTITFKTKPSIIAGDLRFCSVAGNGRIIIHHPRLERGLEAHGFKDSYFGLKRTGIDIQSGKITAQADKFEWLNTNGNQIMGLDSQGNATFAGNVSASNIYSPNIFESICVGGDLCSYVVQEDNGPEIKYHRVYYCGADIEGRKYSYSFPNGFYYTENDPYDEEITFKEGKYYSDTILKQYKFFTNGDTQWQGNFTDINVFTKCTGNSNRILLSKIDNNTSFVPIVLPRPEDYKGKIIKIHVYLYTQPDQADQVAVNVTCIGNHMAGRLKISSNNEYPTFNEVTAENEITIRPLRICIGYNGDDLQFTYPSFNSEFISVKGIVNGEENWYWTHMNTYSTT